MHDFLIELQAKLDDLTSKENINSDIGKLQKKIDELKKLQLSQGLRRRHVSILILWQNLQEK